jgi:predicted GTPase
MGYSDSQIEELEKTLNSAECDTIIAGTPIDLGSLLKLNKPVVRVRYEIEEVDVKLEELVDKWLKTNKIGV